MENNLYLLGGSNLGPEEYKTKALPTDLPELVKVEGTSSLTRDRKVV